MTVSGAARAEGQLPGPVLTLPARSGR